MTKTEALKKMTDLGFLKDTSMIHEPDPKVADFFDRGYTVMIRFSLPEKDVDLVPGKHGVLSIQVSPEEVANDKTSSFLQALLHKSEELVYLLKEAGIPFTEKYCKEAAKDLFAVSKQAQSFGEDIFRMLSDIDRDFGPEESRMMSDINTRRSDIDSEERE